MKLLRLIWWCSLLATTAPVAINAAETGTLEIKDVDIPLFDTSSGHPLHRLRVKSGIGSFNLMRINEGVVDFFGAEGTERVKIGTLNFKDASYDGRAGLIDSNAPMLFSSLQGTLSAVGFRYEIRTNRLFLKSAVTMKIPEANIAGREAEVLLSESQPTRDLLLSWVEVRGDVAITELKLENPKLDRIETQRAVYTGAESLLEVFAPVKFWSEGTEGSGTGEYKYRLGKPLAPLRRAAAAPSEASKK
jgi:hypothetical protein